MWSAAQLTPPLTVGEDEVELALAALEGAPAEPLGRGERRRRLRIPRPRTAAP